MQSNIHNAGYTLFTRNFGFIQSNEFTSNGLHANVFQNDFIKNELSDKLTSCVVGRPYAFVITKDGETFLLFRINLLNTM